MFGWPASLKADTVPAALLKPLASLKPSTEGISMKGDTQGLMATDINRFNGKAPE